MKATSLRLGLTLAAAGVIIPTAALAQGTPPATPPAGATPPAVAPVTPAPAPAPAAAPVPGTAAGAAPVPAEAAPATGTPAIPEGATPPPKDAAPAVLPPAASAPVEAAAPAAAPGEAPAPAAAISGYVEAGWHIDFNKNSIHAPSALRGYDAAGGFMLHAAHFALTHSFTPEASAFISLDFGNDAIINTQGYGLFPAPQPGPAPTATGGIPVDAREAYGKWTPGDFTFIAGKFVTLQGIEVVDGPLNPTLTRGFLYTLAEPVGHTGAKMQYGFGGGMAHLGVGLVNGWDVLLDNNNQKTILFNADVIPSPDFHAQIAGYWGAEQANNDKNHRFSIDLTGGAVLGAMTLNFQGNVGTESFQGADRDTWWGLGVQPVFTADAFSLGGRLEYFNDKTGSRIGGLAQKASLLNFTITPGYMVAKNMTLRAEFRIDAALAGKDAGGNDFKNIFNGKSTQPTVGIGAHYTF